MRVCVVESSISPITLYQLWCSTILTHITVIKDQHYTGILPPPLRLLYRLATCAGGGGLVGLVSYPGSGNTWVRGLLQKVTGICTGTVCLYNYVIQTGC